MFYRGKLISFMTVYYVLFGFVQGVDLHSFFSDPAVFLYADPDLALQNCSVTLNFVKQITLCRVCCFSLLDKDLDRGEKMSADPCGSMRIRIHSPGLD